MYLVHSPLFPQHRAYVLSFRVCAHWQNCHACVYLFSTFHCRACVYLGILPACVHLLPSIGLRACVWVYRLPAFICRLPLACMHCGVSPACVVLPPSIGVRALWRIACLRCFSAFHRRACIVVYRLLALFFTAFHRCACIVAYRLLVLFCRLSLACGSTCIYMLSISHSCAYIGQTACLCLFDHFWFLFTCMHWTNRWLAFITTEGNREWMPYRSPIYNRR